MKYDIKSLPIGNNPVLMNLAFTVFFLHSILFFLLQCLLDSEQSQEYIDF